MYWFHLDWWQYLLEGIKWTNWKNINPISHIKCRVQGHKCGVVWYSSNLEPDMHCKNCHDWLG